MTASAGPALQRLYDEYGGRVQFLTLYVREAHPGDRYVQPHDADTKMAQARAYAERDDIRWPVAVDDVEGTLHRQLDPKPDAAYLVDTDGTVIFRRLWANHPGPIENALQAAAAGAKGPLGQNETLVPSMLRGAGTMWETVSAAGPVALADVAKHAPPMAMSARIAHAMRPLPPLARGALGMTLPMAAMAGGVLLWRRHAGSRHHWHLGL